MDAGYWSWLKWFDLAAGALTYFWYLRGGGGCIFETGCLFGTGLLFLFWETTQSLKQNFYKGALTKTATVTNIHLQCLFSWHEGILIYFNANSFDSVTYINKKGILMQHLQHPIWWFCWKDPCGVKIRIHLRMALVGMGH